MKNASKTMYRIGNLVNIIYLALGALFLVLGILFAILCAVNDDPKLASAGGTLIGWGVYFVIFTILCFIFVGKAQRELNDESKKSLAPYIVSIVFGALSENPFYVLGGIFGIIAESKQGNKEEPKQVEEPKE